MTGVRPVALLLLLSIVCGLGACGTFLLGLGSVLGGRDPDDPVIVSVHEHALLGTYDAEAHRQYVYLYFVSDPSRFMAAKSEDLIVPAGPVPGGVFAEKVMGVPERTVEKTLGPPGSEIHTHVGALVPFFKTKSVGRAVARIPTDGRMRLEFIDGTPGSLEFRPDDR